MRCDRVGPVRWSVEAGVLTVVIDGPVNPDDAPSVCAELRALMSGSDVCLVSCRGTGLADPDLATVDLLTRLRLAAGRVGQAMRVEDPSRRLRQLVVLAGLEELLLPPGSGAQTWWQAEQREEPLGVEEGIEPHDPPR